MQKALRINAFLFQNLHGELKLLHSLNTKLYVYLYVVFSVGNMFFIIFLIIFSRELNEFSVLDTTMKIQVKLPTSKPISYFYPSKYCNIQTSSQGI